MFLIFIAMRGLEVLNAVSELLREVMEKIDADWWKNEIDGTGWCEKQTARERIREPGEGEKQPRTGPKNLCRNEQERGTKTSKSSKMCSPRWLAAEHGEEACGKIQSHVGHLLRDLAQDKERGDGG